MTDQDQNELLMRQIQQSVRSMEYPLKVDVVDAVMKQIEDPKSIRPKVHLFTPWKAIAGIAACAAICLIVNLTILYSRSYNDSQLGTMMAEVYDNNHIYEEEDTTLYASDEIMNYYIAQ